ncbi:MAG: hypothetical protein M3452_07240 [Chloroflexota bacterium]|nr:hypothetical protein [Chloroflexota bacterium]
MTERADPSAAATGTGPSFEPFRLERETKPDGRGILFYSWPDEPPVPDGLSDAGVGSGTAPVRQSAPEAEPWSPETQPADEAGRSA